MVKHPNFLFILRVSTILSKRKGLSNRIISPEKVLQTSDLSIKAVIVQALQYPSPVYCEQLIELADVFVIVKVPSSAGFSRRQSLFSQSFNSPSLIDTHWTALHLFVDRGDLLESMFTRTD